MTAQIEPVIGTRYTTSDHLGTPRVVTDTAGNVVSRHDYQPFGEELGAGVGSRMTSQGYSVADGVRQKLSGKERDDETGLDYFGARYYASTQGRFTSPDPLSFWMLDRKKQPEYLANPQRWNKYVFVLNNPLRYVDPDGLAEVPTWENLDKKLREDLAKRLGKDAEKTWNGWSNDQRQNLLNARAVLIESGLWNKVCAVAYGEIKQDSRYGVQFTADNKGYALAFTVEAQTWPDQYKVLADAGFTPMINLNHPENYDDWYQPDLGSNSDGIIIHLGTLKTPSNDWVGAHFDSGGGSILSYEHFKDWRNRTGPSPDRVTGALGNTPAARHLRGISESMDKLLVSPKR
jgi:RHS repeat-associated protein